MVTSMYLVSNGPQELDFVSRWSGRNETLQANPSNSNVTHRARWVTPPTVALHVVLLAQTKNVSLNRLLFDFDLDD